MMQSYCYSHAPAKGDVAKHDATAEQERDRKERNEELQKKRKTDVKTAPQQAPNKSSRWSPLPCRNTLLPSTGTSQWECTNAFQSATHVGEHHPHGFSSTWKVPPSDTSPPLGDRR